VGGLAPRALRDSVRPRRLAGVGARPLNFTVRRHPHGMREIPIKEIQIDAAGYLRVYPDLPPAEDFGFIWRTATGIRWNGSGRFLTSVDQDRSGHLPWFRRVLDAVRSEYGCELTTSSQTQWTNVPDDVRSAMEVGAGAV
jgi:hypothetical protein